MKIRAMTSVLVLNEVLGTWRVKRLGLVRSRI